MQIAHNASKRACATALALVVGALARPAAADVNSYVPASGGPWSVNANWSLGHIPVGSESPEIVAGTTADKIVTYNWGGLTNFPLLRLDGSASHVAQLQQSQLVLTVQTERIATSGGDATHQVDGPAYLWVNQDLWIGYGGSGIGRLVLDTIANDSAGLYVGDLCYVGYFAAGELAQRGGFADIGRLFIGQNQLGTYLMHTPVTGLLQLRGTFVLGNGAAGTIDQTGGTIRQIGTNGLIVGLNSGGTGTYLMKGGALELDHISIAWNGDGFFTQSGGTVSVAGDVYIGCEGTHPSRSWYKLNAVDGPAALNVGGDLNVGPVSAAKYEQSGGTATVGGNIAIFDGDPGPGYSYLYMGTDAGTLTAQQLWNVGGYFDQDGGVLEVSRGINDSPQGMNLDNSADCRIGNLTHNAGTFWIWRNAILRGPRAFGNTYFVCEFTNNATFQMGSAASAGGSFRGRLTNNGTFNYHQGDFADSRLTNAGVFNMYADFNCLQVVNTAAITIGGGRTLSAGSAAYANAFENAGQLTLQPGATLAMLAGKPLQNTGALVAGGTTAAPTRILGNVESDGEVAVVAGAAIGQLTVEGSFAAREPGSLHVRLAGSATPGVSYDRLTTTGALSLRGELVVELASGFTPTIGDRFTPVLGATRDGAFSKVSLPPLPAGRRWDLTYGSNALRLAVIADVACPADIDRSGAVGLIDLAILLSNYGGTGNLSSGDLDQNGLVNLADLAMLLTVFGTDCP